MSIYTKTGDKGITKVFDKKSGQLIGISKDSCKIAAIGAIDELNSFLGVIKSHYYHSNDSSGIKKIEEIQGNLFTINSILAGANLRFSKTKTKKLEKEIDKWEGELPVQKNFIFYGGTPRASQLFYARSICRRAERALVVQSTEYRVPSGAIMYINRLSDYLFMMARRENFKAKVKEKFWKTSK
ncbi:MAG: cob(I)yrinic acid a,c-diamide adenosyltransferase [Candidatus Woesebacteria bacterium]|nr:MAG: cob(I)yrinic acid a,c-diamide adenosyltransferase [Candidatus Woesebacteria bacterium]